MKINKVLAIILGSLLALTLFLGVWQIKPTQATRANFGNEVAGDDERTIAPDVYGRGLSTSCSGSGTIESFTAEVHTYGNNQHFYVAIYNSTYDYIGQSLEATVTSSGDNQWITTNADGTIAVTPQNYYFVVQGQAGGLVALKMTETGSSGMLQDPPVTYPNFPASVSDWFKTDGKLFCVYATYTSGGGPDTTPPTFGSITANTTLAGNGTQISCTVSDETELSAWGFAWNNTGSTVNATKILVSGTSVTALFNGTWESTVGDKVWVQFWANDTTNNEAYSNVQTFTLTTSSGKTNGDGVADSSWTYRISQNETSCYRINTAGTILENNANPAIMINNALSACTSGGSIYVYPDTYATATSLGSTAIYANWTDIYLYFGADTTLDFSGADYSFNLKGWGAYIVNFTLTSNGTVTFDGNGLKSGWWFQNVLNCTFANARIEHSNGEFILQRWARYCRYENLTGFGWNEGAYANAGFNNNQVQYCTFYNITIDGNNGANTRGAVYMGDWEETAGWVGTCFNNWTKIWIKNVKRTGFYLNSGALGNQVYNNTFTNCTIENNWEPAYNAIKLRPAQNSTFAQIVIRNWTDPITTGTAYAGGECGNGNTTGNHVQADITSATVTGLILCSDDNNQEVSGNFFNLTFQNSKGIYVAFGTNSPVKNNVIYANFTNCNYGIRLEEGPMRDNTFYLNFSNCDGDGHADIYHYSTWTEITDNTFKIYATSGNTYGFMDFVNGTQGNIVLYPYTGTTETEVNVIITSPTNTTYTSPTIPVELYAYGGTIYKIWWNCTFSNGTVVYANTVYTVPTSMTLGSGSYIFNCFANNTDGDWDEATVMFTVNLSAWINGTTYTCRGHAKDVYISGGTVISVELNGIIVFESTNVMVHLEPTWTIRIVWNVVPTIKVFGE